MLLSRAISLLSVFTAVVFAELVPVSPYIGKHKANCPQQSKITGTLVNGKIYTFGGCYALAYIVDPDDESDNTFRRYDEHQNVTESSHVYDIASDTWSFEKNTPRPLAYASTIVVNKDIYFYNIGAKPRTTELHLWKYSTDTKTWSEPAQLPFLYHGNLLTCHKNDKMYFMGSGDGFQRNIVRVQNLLNNQWEDPIYLDKRINAKKLLCHDKHISVIGESLDKMEDDMKIFDFQQRDSVYNQNLINVYHNGSVQIADNFNVTLGHNRNGRRAQVLPVKEWFYIFGLNGSSNATEIIKINTLTLETVHLDTLPYALTNVLIVPTENDEIYLFGGGKEKIFGRITQVEQDPSVPKIKTYNHKFIVSPPAVVEEIADESSEQDGHFKLQVPYN